MSERRHKTRREKDITSRFLSGELEVEALESEQKFTQRSKGAQQSKIEKTALLRAAEGSAAADLDLLPTGQVMQVYSLYCEVDHSSGQRLCVIRKTLSKLSQTMIVVGDWVKFRDTEMRDEIGRQEAVIEQVLPRKTVLTRAAAREDPIVANADQMLIVVSLAQPRPKWGLADRMIIAAQSGGLAPIVCLNKVDLADESERSRKEYVQAREALGHYRSMGILTLETQEKDSATIAALAQLLAGKTTVVAGHSGVGKSTLIAAVQPGLDIRIGVVSAYNEKGRHTTTSARRYPLDIGGWIIDTPGIKHFGLWGVGPENLADYFPDVENQTAPAWRVESYQRIAESLAT
jgi:ribosome biogenesis GTPase